MKNETTNQTKITNMETINNPLQDFKQRAIWAHNWTSFSPERSGEQMIQDYGTELTADIEELKSKGIDEANISDYTARYKRFFSSWIGAKSNCFNTMITGSSGVNVRKHEKANRSEQRHYEVFREWRERAKKAIIRKSLPAKTFSSELERYRNELNQI